MIRVAILANSELRARNLADLLSEDERLDIVEAKSVAAGPAQSTIFAADVVLAVNLSPDILPSEGPPAVVVSDEPIEETPFRQSVRAWLPGRIGAPEIAAALIAAAADLIVLTPRQATRWLRAVPPTDHDEDSGVLLENLTPREVQVLRMLADGLGNKEIALQLRISDHTAKFHVAQILAKLGAASRTEAVTIGIRRGLVAI